MKSLRIGFIGTGKKKLMSDGMGYAMAYEHANGYHALAQCELVACADIVQENAVAFAQVNGIPTDGVFTDYKEMLKTCNLDVVSICTWPHLHAPMVIDSALAGVSAIHCEKPMADSYGASQLMEQTCRETNVQLTFNHQRRFCKPLRKAQELLKSGAIGELQRIEIASVNVYDYGVHLIDACGLFTGEQGADWVIGQIDYRTEQILFGAHVENQSIALWHYPSGVFGFMSTGLGRVVDGADIRLLGSNGIVEIGGRNRPSLRIQTHEQSAWESVDVDNETLHSPGLIQRAIADSIDALETGRKSELRAGNALHAMEIIFAIYESSRARARVDLPLKITDNPLSAMVAAGDLHPQPRE